jgi:phosphoribosyl-AMP cyclohydrolase
MTGLSSMHLNEKPESLLILATNAVALSMQGASSSQSQKKQLGQKYYNQASGMSDDIMQDSSTCDTDETLMAVYLLGFYEVSRSCHLLNCNCYSIFA